MRIDYEYMEKILEVFLDGELPIVDWRDFEYLRGKDDEFEHKFVFHIEIMVDKDLITGLSDSGKIGIRRSSNGEYSVSVVPWRLAADGHDFASALSKPDILSSIKENFQREGLSAVMDITKKLAAKQAEKLLE